MRYIPRDPERIDKVLAALEKYWKNPKNTDQRLGQIICNLSKLAHWELDDPFYFEDDKLLEMLGYENERNK